MANKLTVPPLQQSKKKVNKLLIVLLTVLLLAAVGLGLYFVTQQQVSTRTRADQEPTAVPGTSSCPVDGASCAWDPVELQDVTYEYVIRNTGTGTVVKSGTTTSTSVTFTPEIGVTYECSVRTTNQCGKSEPVSGYNTCVGPDEPTPTEVIPTPTIPTTCGGPCQDTAECGTGMVCSNQTCQLEKCVNPQGGTICSENKCAVVTPTVTPTSTPGPTATPTPGPSATPTPGPSATPTPTGVIVAQSATSTPAPVSPTLPSAGGNSSIYFMVISTILVVTLFLVF